MWTALLALAACTAAVAGVLLAWSHQGVPAPFLDTGGRPVPGSVAQKVYVEIGGVRQGMILRGRDASKPVLLYLHGGMPDYFLSRLSGSGLEELFTVCWWEQRGTGISYDPAARESVTADRLVADTIAVTRYLQQRFGQERIYLMGHSGGTFLAALVLQRAPELYAAYVGVAQMGSQLESEREAYRHLLAEYRRLGDEGMVRRLEAAPVTREGGVPQGWLAVRDQAMHAAGVGTTRAMRSVVTGVFLPSLRSPEYTLAEKLRTWRGKASSGVSTLWAEMLRTDLAAQVPELDVPVYLLHGVHDYTCTYAQARAWYGRLRAPRKAFYSFPASAHSPVFEEPERALRILREDVLAGRRELADPG